MIESKRLILRPFDCNDLDIIMGIYSDEEIMKYMPDPVMDKDMAQNRLDKNVAGWEVKPQISYEMAIILKDTNEKIGRAEIIREYSEDSAMIGCLLLKSEWGKGYATEIGNALIDYCFNELQVHRVYGLCHPDNTGSWKTMEKCGMHREAHYIRKRKYTKADGIRWEDELEYAIIKPDA